MNILISVCHFTLLLFAIHIFFEQFHLLVSFLKPGINDYPRCRAGNLHFMLAEKTLATEDIITTIRTPAFAR